MFRRSIYDYLFRLGMVDAEAAKNPPIATAWQRQSSWIEHLWTTAAENWVALDEADCLIGWALSIERDGHLELAFFFVEPGVQGKGLGKTLIEKAMPRGRGNHRTINATQDPRALSVYLRSGVRHVATSVDVIVRPGKYPNDSDLYFECLDGSDRSVAAIIGLEKTVLGFARVVDIKFMLTNRPAWLAVRDGVAVGYAFGVQPNPQGVADFAPASGPMAAFDPTDMPTLIDHVMSQAGDIVDFVVAVPLANQHAMTHLLNRGGQIDPFYLMILSDSTELKLDRYIHTSPTFIL